MKQIVKAILTAGLVTGLLDGLAAILSFYLQTQKNPVLVFQYISSALIGPESYSVQWTIWFGIFLHFTVAMGWAALFGLSYLYLPIASRNRVVTGLVYGLLVWLAMNFIVIPLTPLKPAPLEWPKILIGIGIHLVCVGTPIVWIIFAKLKR